jgi:lipoyl-dependent peroxiredoxin
LSFQASGCKYTFSPSVKNSCKINIIKKVEMETITQSTKVLYTAKTRTTGGREGSARSSDGKLDIKLSKPGSNGPGTNPEQLFAAGWSACFEASMGIAARQLHVQLPEGTAVDAEVDLCHDQGESWLQARINIILPGVEANIAEMILAGAQQICPYSKAVKGNINVEYKVKENTFQV